MRTHIVTDHSPYHCGLVLVSPKKNCRFFTPTSLSLLFFAFVYYIRLGTGPSMLIYVYKYT
jgi:hypothetical protein